MTRHSVTELEAGLVARRPDQMYGWPGIEKLGSGEILAASSERKVHVDPFGRIVIHRSRDNGRTWDLPQEIYNSELDDRDATVRVFPDGTILVAWFTSTAWMAAGAWAAPSRTNLWAERARRVAPQTVAELAHDWLIRSTDNGRTWETKPTRLPEGGSSHCGPFVLADGTLCTFGLEESAPGARGMFYYESQDKGDTWTRLGEAPATKTLRRCGANPLAQETHVPVINERYLLETAPGKFLVLFRTSSYAEDPDRHMLQYASEDRGRTWRCVGRFPDIGFPAGLLRLKSGTILCSYSHRQEPPSIRLMFSDNEGASWDAANIVTLEGWETSQAGDFGYPVSVETAPNEVLTVYYRHFWIGHPKNFAPGERAGLLFKRYRVD